MQPINTKEYGQTIRVNMGEDILTNIGLSFIIQPKIGDTLVKTDANGVIIGIVDIIEGNQTFKANQYLEYTTQPKDFNYSGQWRMRGEVKQSATKLLINDYVRFEVLD